MAHCAEIDNQGIVQRVIVVEDYYDDLTCEQWCIKTYGGMWKKTSYNTIGNKHYIPDGLTRDDGIPFRGNYAGIGSKYDSENDIFIPRQPFPSWTFNVKTASWEAPKVKPNDGKYYDWNEKTQEWVKF